MTQSKTQEALAYLNKKLSGHGFKDADLLKFIAIAKKNA